jgi:hypothetical protein
MADSPRDPLSPRPAPRPEPASSTDAHLAELQGSMDELASIARGMQEVVERLNEPASITTHVLTQTRPRAIDDAHAPALSIGVFNPNDVTIFWGIGGGLAEPGRRAISQPGKSLLVLPVGATSLELGATAADLAAGDAVLFLLRFESVQPASFGGLA